MTKAEAIRILDPETSGAALEPYRLDCELMQAKVEEACRVAVEVMRELAEYNKNGRLVILPCKVGDTIWFRTYDQNGTVDLGIRPHKVTATRTYVITKGKYTDVDIPLGQFGVTAFLTREQAEGFENGGH